MTSVGDWDIFVSKLDSSGNFLWAKQLGGTLPDLGYSIALDAFGNVYTTGLFQVTADFDPGADTFNMTSAGSFDIFISKLDSSGNFLWAKQLGGASDDYGYSIAVNTSGNVYTTGYFQDTADFDPGADTLNMFSVGGLDIFVHKMSQQCTPTSVTQSGNTLTANASGAAYQWLDCNNSYTPVSAETNQSFTATASGSFAVEVTQNGCKDTSACYLITTIGILENTFGSALAFFPNPTSGNLVVDLGRQYGNVTVKIRSVKGQLISTTNFGTASRITFGIVGATGFYFVDILTTEGKSATLKVMKN